MKRSTARRAMLNLVRGLVLGVVLGALGVFILNVILHTFPETFR